MASGGSAKGEREFGISRGNKEFDCPFKPILYQEGYCHGCQAYLNRQKNRKAGTRATNKRA